MSATPRTDSAKKVMAVNNATGFELMMCPVKFCEQLETELAELKRQIKDGELIQAAVASAYYETHIDRVMPLEEFAKQKAAEAKQ